jgi:hypothetical protein
MLAEASSHAAETVMRFNSFQIGHTGNLEILDSMKGGELVLTDIGGVSIGAVTLAAPGRIGKLKVQQRSLIT